jgi:hypothetical protein
MDRNTNPQTVTLAVELYEELIRMADSSDRYTTRRIRKHARKFNPHLQPAHQALVRKNEGLRSKRIVAARKMLAKATGKVVYVETSVNYSSGPLKDLVFTPMIVKRLNKGDRGQLLVFKEGETKFGHYSASSVTPDCIHLELPEDYYRIPDAMLSRNYAGLWVKVDSPMYWYAIEAEAHTEDFYREEHKRLMGEPVNDDPKRFVQAVDQIHYHDVIGDR